MITIPNTALMGRIVCRNANKLLKRKDSSGTILKDGQLKPADYSKSLAVVNVSS